MHYTTAETAPWQKTVTVTVSVEDVNTVLDDLEKRHRAFAKAPGFRDGKVPLAVVRSQFKDKIAQEARTQIVDKQITVVLSDIKLEPVTQMDVQAENAVDRGQHYTYTFSFYYLPEFALPVYEGVAVTEFWAPVLESEVEAVLENVRRTTPVQVAVTEPRKPVDGDVAVIDFELREENGSLCGKLHGKGVRVLVGDGGALQAFEQVLKKVTLGEAREESVTLPEDFVEPALARSIKKLYIKLHTLAERRPSLLDDALAPLVNPAYTSLSQLRKAVKEELTRRKEARFRQSAEEKLLHTLLEQTDIPLPEGMVARYREYIIDDIRERVRSSGKTLAELGRDEKTLAHDAQSEAERLCQRQLLMQRVAKKEGVIVNDAEIHSYIRREAATSGVPYPQALAQYTSSGHILTLRDRLLADKVMEILYSKAQVRREQVSAPADSAVHG